MIKLRSVLFVVAVCCLIWFSGYLLFLASIPSSAPSANVKTDAIIVLTGDKGRLAEGLELLRQDAAKYLFISGVSQQVDFDTLAKNLPHMAGRAGIVVLGHQATDTVGNADETAAWIKENKQKSIRLVTSYYHMPRSLLEFENRLPENMLIVPHAVFLENNTGKWGSFLNIRMLRITLGEYHKFFYSWIGHAIS